MTIHITANHIRAGKRGECQECPIALAIQELLHPRAWCSVSGDMVAFGFGTSPVAVYGVALPSVAVEFVRNFDASVWVEGMVLEVEVPGEFLRRGV